jgi:hypothetical protein
MLLCCNSFENKRFLYQKSVVFAPTVQFYGERLKKLWPRIGAEPTTGEVFRRSFEA